MNRKISKLRKNYHKLRAEERFKAIMAAINRVDEQERRALLESAPTVTISVTHTYGLLNVFERFTIAHRNRQLSLAVIIKSLIGLLEDDTTNAQNDKALLLALILSRMFADNEKAWRQVCKEFEYDPDLYQFDSFDIGIYSNVLDMIRNIAGDDGMDLKALKRAYGEQMEFESVEVLVEEYSNEIISLAGEWL